MSSYLDMTFNNYTSLHITEIKFNIFKMSYILTVYNKFVSRAQQA